MSSRTSSIGDRSTVRILPDLGYGIQAGIISFNAGGEPDLLTVGTPAQATSGGVILRQAFDAALAVHHGHATRSSGVTG